jgi:hypothetical protein
VVHRIVAVVLVTGHVAIEAMTGGAVAVVVNVKFAEVDVALDPFVDATSKLYVVARLSPVSVTECDVTSVLTSADCDPYDVVVP